MRWRDWPLLIVSGLCGYGIYQLFYMVGLAHTRIFDSSLLIATVPVWTAIVLVALRLDRVSWLQWIGIVMSLAGVGWFLLEAQSGNPSSAPGAALTPTDILFGNAAILGPLTPLSHLQPSVWEEVMRINVTANWRLIRTFDALLRLSDAGRALFVSSAVAHGNRPFWGAYSISKAALESMIRTYAAELAGTTVRANLLNPGPTRTDMRAAAMPAEDPMTLPAPEELTPLIVELLSPACDDTGELFTFKRP